MFKCIVELVKELSKEFDRVEASSNNNNNNMFDNLSNKDLLLVNYVDVSVDDTTDGFTVNVQCK